MARKLTREFEVFVILVDGGFQTVRGDWDAAVTVRDNFNESFQKHGHAMVAEIVHGVLTYNPSDVVSEP